MKNLGTPVRIGIWAVVVAALGVLGYALNDSVGKGVLFALVGVAIAAISEVPPMLQARGTLPELRHDGYGKQTPSWYENEKKEGEQAGGEAADEA